MRTVASTFVAAAVAGAVCLGSDAAAQSDFQWHGQILAGQTIEVKNVNGDIRAMPSVSTDAAVTATKTARRSNPADVRIEVVPHPGGVTICAVYPDVAGREPNRCEPGSDGHSHTQNNDTVVHFTVHVPAGVKFVGATVNGGIDGESLTGDVEGRAVNGSVRLSTTGAAIANTVNGSIHVTMGRADWPSGASFSTVNGGITLDLPGLVNADVRASTVNGDVTSDYPIEVSGQISRRRVNGRIGSGGQELRLTTVNGSIKLLKAQ